MYSVPLAVSRLPKTSGRMPYGSRNAEHAVAGDHRDDRVGAAAAPVHACDGARRRRLASAARRADALQLVREHVEQHLGVGARC